MTPAAQPASRPAMRWVPRRWLRLPRRTVRLRLTIVYGGLFLLSGAGLLAITYFLVEQHLPVPPILHKTSVLRPPGNFSTGQARGQVFFQAGTGTCHLSASPTRSPEQAAAQAQQCLNQQRDLALNQLLTESGVALGIMAVVSIGLGWLVAGRVLGKLRTITAAARSISASSLHARLALDG